MKPKDFFPGGTAQTLYALKPMEIGVFFEQY